MSCPLKIMARPARCARHDGASAKNGIMIKHNTAPLNPDSTREINTTRRTLLQTAALLMAVPFPLYAGGNEASRTQQDAATRGPFLMPDEGAPHAATWMAFGATAEAWGTSGIYGASRNIARKDLMRIAANLSRFETVNMLVAHPADLRQARQLLAEVKDEPTASFAGVAELPAIEAGGAIQFLLRPLNDLWIRDTGPVFVRDHHDKLYGVNFNFNGWGQDNTGASGWRKDRQKAANGVTDQPIAQDRLIADFVTRTAGATRLNTWLVMEGGGIEVDGKGTALCTESCILNPNRNPGRSKQEVEAELRRVLGIQKVIWLPGIRGQEITDGHVDFYARFVGDASVVFALDEDPDSVDYAPTLANQQILSGATNALGNKITAIPLKAPDFARVRTAVEARHGWSTGKSSFNTAGFAAGYIGFYLTSCCVLMAKFGDAEADQAAFATLQTLYKGRAVIQIETDGVANGGGTIHCATQQQIQAT